MSAQRPTNMRQELKLSIFKQFEGCLFDYESKNYSIEKYKISQNSLIVKSNDNLSCICCPKSEINHDKDIVLGSFISEFNHFYFTPQFTSNNKSNIVHKFWLVIKSLKKPKYQLIEGQIIKLGGVELKLKEISIVKRLKNLQKIQSVTEICYEEINLSEKLKINAKLYENESEKVVCRICLLQETKTESFLISPCLCQGTIGKVHLQCLQKWLNCKISKLSHNTHIKYSWDKLECELCKFEYPDKIMVNGQLVDLISIDKPRQNYVIFENLSERSKNINVVEFSNKNKIKIGRCDNADFIIPDLSISRIHAMIKLKNEKVYLKDLQSKFGTLIGIDTEICLDLNSNFQIQFGKFLLKIEGKKSLNILRYLFGCSKNEDSDQECHKHEKIIKKL